MVEPRETHSADLTQRQIFSFFVPLALSWLFMAVENPVSQRVLSMSPDSIVNRAGLGLLFSLAISIESPVIDLLTTSTTLGKGRHSYVLLSRFAWMMMILVTVVHATVAFTPLYWFVTERMIGAPHEVAVVTRVPMMIMSCWSAFVGWRRYLHGLMIRSGVTRPISYGTAIRMITMAAVGFGVQAVVDWGGLTVVAVALFASVVAETSFIHLMSRPLVRSKYWFDQEDDDPTLDMKRLFKFHAPLTVSTFITILSMPLVTFILAKSPDPVLTLAAWPVGYALMWILRTTTFALPETVVSLAKDRQSVDALRKFCVTVGVVLSIGGALMHFTGVDRQFFHHVLDAEPELWDMAGLAMLLTIAMPFLNALMSYVRGLLTSLHITKARLVAIAWGLSVMCLLLAAGVMLQWTGIVTAAVGLTFGQLAELIILYRRWVRAKASNPPLLDV